MESYGPKHEMKRCVCTTDHASKRKIEEKIYSMKKKDPAMEQCKAKTIRNLLVFGGDELLCHAGIYQLN